jgi:hypothetical protein
MQTEPRDMNRRTFDAKARDAGFYALGDDWRRTFYVTLAKRRADGVVLRVLVPCHTAERGEKRRDTLAKLLAVRDTLDAGNVPPTLARFMQ